MRKQVYCLSLFFSLACVTSAQTLNWSAPVKVADGAVYGNSHPRIDFISGNRPVVMWTKAGSSRIIYSSVLTGGAFSTPVRVNPVGSDPRLLSFDGPNMRSSNDTIFAVYYSPSSGAGNVYVVRSSDGGLTYGPAVMVNPSNGMVTDFPYVGIAPGGNPVVTYMQMESNWTDPRYVVRASADGGLTYGTEKNVTALAPGEVCECCPPSSAISGSRQVVMFRNNDSDLRDIWASVSADGGSTWPLSSDIDDSKWILGICPSSGPSGIIAGDSLVSAWMTGVGGPSRIKIGTMDLASAQPGFNAYLDPTPGNYVQNFPAIAGNADTIGVVWHDNRRGNYDCAFAVSVNGAAGLPSGISWVDTASGSQIDPDVAYYNGTFYVVYTDVLGKGVMFRTATVDGAVGVRNASPEPVTGIVPNPFREHATVYFSKVQRELRLTLYDVTGRKAAEYTVRNSDRLKIEKGDLGSGIYFLTGSAETGEVIKAKLSVE